MNAGLLLLHVFLGLALVAHALQKAIVFTFPGVVSYLRGFGFRAPRLLAAAVIGNELVGGLLIALGLLTPLGAAIVAATMLVASRTDHRGKGWFITGPGSEFVITNAVIAVTLVLAGPGRYSLDHVLGLDLHGLAWAGAVVVAAVAGATTVLAAFRRPFVVEAREAVAQ